MFLRRRLAASSNLPPSSSSLLSSSSTSASSVPIPAAVNESDGATLRQTSVLTSASYNHSHSIPTPTKILPYDNTNKSMAKNEENINSKKDNLINSEEQCLDIFIPKRRQMKRKMMHASSLLALSTSSNNSNSKNAPTAKPLNTADLAVKSEVVLASISSLSTVNLEKASKSSVIGSADKHWEDDYGGVLSSSSLPLSSGIEIKSNSHNDQIVSGSTDQSENKNILILPLWKDIEQIKDKKEKVEKIKKNVKMKMKLNVGDDKREDPVSGKSDEKYSDYMSDMVMECEQYFPSKKKHKRSNMLVDRIDNKTSNSNRAMECGINGSGSTETHNRILPNEERTQVLDVSGGQTTDTPSFSKALKSSPKGKNKKDAKKSEETVNRGVQDSHNSENCERVENLKERRSNSQNDYGRKKDVEHDSTHDSQDLSSNFDDYRSDDKNSAIRVGNNIENSLRTDYNEKKEILQTSIRNLDPGSSFKSFNSLPLEFRLTPVVAVTSSYPLQSELQSVLQLQVDVGAEGRGARTHALPSHEADSGQFKGVDHTAMRRSTGNENRLQSTGVQDVSNVSSLLILTCYLFLFLCIAGGNRKLGPFPPHPSPPPSLLLLSSLSSSSSSLSLGFIIAAVLKNYNSTQLNLQKNSSSVRKGFPTHSVFFVLLTFFILQYFSIQLSIFLFLSSSFSLVGMQVPLRKNGL